MSDQQLRQMGSQCQDDLIRKCIDSLYFLELGIESPRQSLYDKFWKIQQREAVIVLREILACQVQPLVIKGLELGVRYCGNRAVGLRGDVDILVPSKDLWAARKVLYQQEYANATYVQESRRWEHVDGVRVARAESNHYELAAFRKGVPIELTEAEADLACGFPGSFFRSQDEWFAIVTLDVHHSLFLGFDVKPMLSRAVESSLGVGLSLSPADHLWFLIHRYYIEVALGRRRSLRSLSYIAPILQDSQVDWAVVLQDAAAVAAPAPTFYWLAFFEQIAPHSVPAEVLGELTSLLPGSRFDWGWQISRLFDVLPPSPAWLTTAGDARDGMEGSP